MDLDDRVEKAQKNAGIINKLMKEWDSRPLFTRYDDNRKDNLFNMEGRLLLKIIDRSTRGKSLLKSWDTTFLPD